MASEKLIWPVWSITKLKVTTEEGAAGVTAVHVATYGKLTLVTLTAADSWIAHKTHVGRISVDDLRTRALTHLQSLTATAKRRSEVA